MRTCLDSDTADCSVRAFFASSGALYRMRDGGQVADGAAEVRVGVTGYLQAPKGFEAVRQAAFKRVQAERGPAPRQERGRLQP